LLDKNSQKILKYLNKHSSSENLIDIETLCDKTKFDINTAKEITNSLYKNKLINKKTKLIVTQDRIVAHGLDRFYSTNKGKQYFNVKHQEKFEQYLNSILCPIIVSILTNVVVWTLKYLFPNLLSR